MLLIQKGDSLQERSLKGQPLANPRPDLEIFSLLISKYLCRKELNLIKYSGDGLKQAVKNVI